MSDRTRLVLRAWIASWKTWLVLLVVGIDLALQLLVVDADGLLTLWQFCVGLAVGANVGLLFHDHVLRSGRMLLPGVVRTHARLAGLVGGSLLLPTVVISVADPSRSWAWTASLAIGSAFGLTLSTVRSASVRGALAGLVGGAVGVLLGETSRAHAGTGPSVLAKAMADPTITIPVAITTALVTAVVLRSIVTAREGVGWAQRRAAGPSFLEGWAPGQDDDWLTRVLPFTRRTPVVDRRRTTLPDLGRVASIWRSASGPMRPLVYGVLFGVLMNLVSLDALRGADPREILDSGSLFVVLLVGLAPLGMNYSRRLLRVECMRPVRREDLTICLVRAFLQDYVVIVLVALTITLAAYFSLVPTLAADPVFWSVLALVPGVLATGVAITFLAIRWTSFGGVVGTVVTSVGAMVTVGVLGREAAPVEWLAASAGALLIASILFTIGRRVWSEIEIG